MLTDEQLEARRAKGREYYRRNKERQAARTKAWRAANPEKTRALALAYMKRHPDQARAGKERQRAKQYGITVEELRELYLRPRCDICETPFKSSKETHVDHCHKSGKVRGVLCSNCNHGLGKFKDNPAWLRRAADYLE